MNNKITRPFVVVTIFLIIITAAFGEKSNFNKTDSLRQELSKSSGPDKISTQLALAFSIMESDKAESAELANSALVAARNAKNQNLEMRAHFTLGRIHELSGKTGLSKAYYDTAFNLAELTGDHLYKGEILFRQGVMKYNGGEEIDALEKFNASLQSGRLSDNFRIMGSAYSMMGTIFRVNGLYDRAIEYVINARLNYEKAGFSEGNAWCGYILGRIYSDLKLPQKALEYFQEALEIYIGQAAIDGNRDGVAMCYEQIGLHYLSTGNFKEAEKYIDRTLEIYIATRSQYGISNSYKNLGMIEYSRGNYAQAADVLTQSLKAKNQIGDLLNLPTVYEYLGLCLIGKDRTEEGISLLKRGLNQAILNNQKKIQLNIYSKLSGAYLNINDLKNAMICQQKQIEIQDLLLSGAANVKIEQLQSIYELDKKNRQIIELEKQNEINSLIIKQHRISQLMMFTGISVALIISVSVYVFYKKIRRKNLQLKETNAAKDKLFAIIAHDLRGPTGTLAAFLGFLNETFIEHSQDELKNILASLCKSAENVKGLLENLLIWAQSQLDKIEYRPAELKLSDAIQHSFIGLKQAAETKQIDIKFELNNQILVQADPDMVQTILRNLLSNAIKFTHRGGVVNISTDIVNTNRARTRITDNGVGIDKSALSKIFDISNKQSTNGTEDEKSTGLGLILVKDFIEKNKGTITIGSEKGKGTVVSFTLPTTRSVATQAHSKNKSFAEA